MLIVINEMTILFVYALKYSFFEAQDKMDEFRRPSADRGRRRRPTGGVGVGQNF